MLKIIINSFKLAYVRCGHGNPLVLVHGYPLDHTIWNPVVSLLKNDFDLILPDLRGFGQSGIVGTSYLISEMAADIAALLDVLKIKKTAIAGHSMGGYVALAFARNFADRLSGLGLVATQALADTPEKKAGRYQEAEQLLAHGISEVAESMSTKLSVNSVLQTRLKKLILKQRPEGLAGALRAMAERLDSTGIFSTFDFPVAIIHGLADQLIPVERARSIRGAVKLGTLVEIEGVGHMPMLEAPQVTAEALKTLL